MGTAGVARSRVKELNGCQTFVLLRMALLVPHVTLSALKKSVNFVGTLRFPGGKEFFGFKKLLALV